MGRKSHHYRLRKVFPLLRSQPTATPLSALSKPTNTAKPLSSPDVTSSVPVEAPRIDRRPKARRMRKSLRKIVFLTTALNWGITLAAHLIFEGKQGKLPIRSLITDGLKGVVQGVSVLQIGLIFYYWSRYLAYLDVLRMGIQPEANSVPSLLSSPKALFSCLAECLFHLLVFLSSANSSIHFSIFGTENSLSIDELCCLTILVRNYHSLRLLYWYSSFSTLRTAITVDVIGATPCLSFLCRYFLAEYGLPLVLMAYGAMVLLPGLCEYLLEHERSTDQLGVLWNNFWVVFCTQTTIGYGESHPETFFGQLLILISALFGYFTLGLLNSISGQKAALSLRECTFYSEVRYRHEQQRYLPETTVLLQRWWRLMLMRLRKKLEVQVILAYFAQLHVYRNILVACERVKDTRFERQIAAFGNAVQPQLRSLQEYLAPIVENRTLIIDVYRSAYNTKTQCISLLKLTHKYAQSRPQTPKTPSSTRTSLTWNSIRQFNVDRSSQSKAKANKAAFQNLVSRLACKLPKSKSTPSESPVMQRRL